LKFHVSALLRRMPLTRLSPAGLPVIATARTLESQAENESSVYARWTTLKQAVLTTTATTLGHTKKIRNRKPWIKAEMIDKMTQRRKWKSVL